MYQLKLLKDTPNKSNHLYFHETVIDFAVLLQTQ